MSANFTDMEPQAMRTPHLPEVAIVAADIAAALGDGLDAVWTGMLAGQTGIHPYDHTWPHRLQTGVAGQLPENLRQSVCPDPATRCYDLAFHAAQRTIQRSGCNNGGMGLVFSSTKGDLVQLEDAVRHGRQHTQQHFNLHRLACDLACSLGLHGPVMAVSNACASGLIAIIQAARMIQRNQAQTVLVIGADILTDFVIAGFSSLGALSRGRCRPYDKGRDGLSLGEGAGALVLAGPQSCGSPPLAMIRGWGVANDATHITAPSRTGEGLVRALWSTLHMAQWKPHDVHYVNGHGTGTVYNDEMEAQAFHAVFGPSGVPVTSMKGYLGHTLGAAGVIETALCLRVLSDRRIPGSLGCETLGVTQPIHVPGRELIPDSLQRLITVKSGFGGVNAALALERTHD